MPYKVLQPEVDVLHKIGEVLDRDGSVIAHEHESVLYLKDEIVPDDKISPVVVEAYDNGDEHVLDCLERVSDEKPKAKATPGRKKATTTKAETDDEATPADDES